MKILVDVLALVLILVNALHRPYRVGSQVVKRVQRDGLVFNVVRLRATP